MFIFCAVQDDMSFEFDPVSESSDEIEPQSEIGGDSLAWAARKTALEAWIYHMQAAAGRRVISPRGPWETVISAKGGAR